MMVCIDEYRGVSDDLRAKRQPGFELHGYLDQEPRLFGLSYIQKNIEKICENNSIIPMLAKAFAEMRPNWTPQLRGMKAIGFLDVLGIY
jgi:hypothetical protein